MSLFLILWDIDGTLISSGGAGMRALRVAIHKTFGISHLLDDIDYSGRTDRHIMRQIFTKFGLPATEENFARFAEAYLAELPETMKDPRARVLPGIPGLLASIHTHDRFVQGLLTGNLERGARAKLGHHGLWDYFPFGAYADDAELRNDLGAHALRRARARHGVDFAPENVWIIGDTPHDIACARAIGANSLAVATGQHTLADLATHHPTAKLADLSDAAAFWRALG